MPINLGRIYVSCYYGFVGKIVSLGINSRGDGNSSDQCIVNDNNRHCAPDDPHLDQAASLSVGKSSLVLEFTLDQLFKTGSGSGCLGDDARVFIQYTCVMDNAEFASKYQILAMSSCVGVLISLMFFTLIRDLLKRQ